MAARRNPDRPEAWIATAALDAYARALGLSDDASARKFLEARLAARS